MQVHCITSMQCTCILVQVCKYNALYLHTCPMQVQCPMHCTCIGQVQCCTCPMQVQHSTLCCTCIGHQLLVFRIVNQLYININEYHWLIHQPITSLWPCPSPEGQGQRLTSLTVGVKGLNNDCR